MNQLPKAPVSPFSKKRKNDEKSGVEIDWSSAPENKTLSSNELESRKKQKENNSNKNQWKQEK